MGQSLWFRGALGKGPYRTISPIDDSFQPVYLGTSPQGLVVIKFPGDGTHSYVREKTSLQRVRHESIISLLDYRSECDQMPCLVFPHVGGRSLGRMLKSATRISPDRTAAIFSDLSSALRACHDSEVWHRDVKPDNIMITGKKAVLIDFGLSCNPDVESLDEEGVVYGSPLYMAPELWVLRGTARCDLYSLGVSLYRCLTGEYPFVADSVESLRLRQLYQVPDAPSDLYDDVPTRLSDIALHLLEREPEHRYESAHRVYEDLQRFRTKSNRAA
ncbi:protein kinase [Candidatus Woesearchaeota archaeon]|nr:protein kinase [Candidatus Woesearchaeota archaeon]